MAAHNSLSPSNVTALLLAAGTGQRLGGVSKAFLELNNHTLLQHAVRLLTSHARSLVIGVNADVHAAAKEQIAALALPPSTHVLILAGGSSRQETLDRLLAAAETTHVLIHEVARPWVDNADIDGLRKAALIHDAVALFNHLPVRDSLALAHDGKLEKILPRQRVVALQTPHLYRRTTLAHVHALAAEHDWKEDSTAALFLRAGVNLHLVEGSPHNLKVTYPEDLTLLGPQIPTLTRPPLRTFSEAAR
jgi:2-C-methyl-D-erythritol 4-phosphate cytidylyltransferase